MSTADRARRREDVDKAYQLQVRAATIGAAQYTAVGAGSAMLAHRYWPLFRRQTLQFKVFLISISTIFGLVIHADNALLSHEEHKRVTETALRREARIDLARRGMIATETEIAKWKVEKEKAQALAASRSEGSSQQ
ncbi:hypothetical protein JAAARDRAFT_118959 [Jaapia argillacea MUCL 33604]|uniref:HIG1 domain-containing protein n=1 Tax=Jaapia argillacea MUCL 33604 TaxID=933084 RepID=A0A067QCG4_9AGAM|nr:hypothetical protein JAAARDRAFT_118959 [Jaapia argillacea MUCL 33604]